MVPSEGVVVVAYQLLVAQQPEEHFQRLAVPQGLDDPHDAVVVVGQSLLAVLVLNVAIEPAGVVVQVVMDRQFADCWAQLLMGTLRKPMVEADLQSAER